MTDDEARRFIERITYKPRRSLQFLRLSSQASVQVILYNLDQDATGKSDQPIMLAGSTLIDSRVLSEQALIFNIRTMIIRRELHEVDEWLKLDGKCITNPHPELNGPT